MPIDMLVERIETLQEERSKLKQELVKYQEPHALLSPQEALDILGNFDTVFFSDSIEVKNAFVASLIDFIELEDDNVFIKWKFSL